MTTLISLVAALVAFRFLPHPGNVAPVGAFALIGGFYLDRRYALWVPLATLLVSDLFLNLDAGYAAFHWPRMIDWFVFLLIGACALTARERGWKTKLCITIATPFFFYAISNFGVWLTGINLAGHPYSKDLSGFTDCYAAGLPFLRGSVIGDWGFAVLFIAVMQLAARISKATPSSIEVRH